MDYETLCNCFVAVFKHYKSNDTRVFVIHELRDDSDSFIDFLRENVEERSFHISFNGLAFDGQVTNYIMENHEQWGKGDVFARKIYDFAQKTIDLINNRNFPPYAPWDLKIPHIDVYKLNHWDNLAKRSSLK